MLNMQKKRAARKYNSILFKTRTQNVCNFFTICEMRDEVIEWICIDRKSIDWNFESLSASESRCNQFGIFEFRF